MPTTVNKNFYYQPLAIGVEFSSDAAASWSQSTGVKKTWTSTVTKGDSLRNWRYLIAIGESATTSLTGSRVVVTEKPANWSRKLKSKPLLLPKQISLAKDIRGGLIDLPLPGVPSGTSALEVIARNQGIKNFISKCRSAQRDLQSLVCLGELGETLRMIRHPLQGFYRGIGQYLLTVKKRKNRIPKNRRRAYLAETWLEYSFGWKPLIMEIDSAAKALARMTSEPEISPMIGASGTAQQTVDDYPLWDELTFAGISYRFGMRQTLHFEDKYYGRVYNSRPDEGGNHNVFRVLGFDYSSFVPSVWELIPYSFLVDYFTTIGDCLEAWSFNRSDIRWCSRGTRQYRMNKSYDANVKPSTDPSYNTVWDRGTLGSLSISREVLARGDYSTQALIPSLEFRVPGAGSLKWLNMAALARTHRSIIPF